MVASPFLGAIKEIAQFLGGKLDKLITAVSKQKYPETDLRPVVSALSKVEAAVRTQKPAEFSGKVSIDQTSLIAELRATRKAIENIEIPKPDDSKTLSALEKLQKTLEEKKDDKADLIEAINAIKLSSPDTVKLDPTQVDRIANAGHTTDSVREAKAVTVAKVTMTSANTEYSYKFPGRTIAFELRLRSTNVPLLIAHATGKFPTSGDDSTYFTVPSYYIKTNDGMSWGNKTIYLQTASATQVCEVISYQA